jgi:peptidyl-prolyl cis-trans isomerase D
MLQQIRDRLSGWVAALVIGAIAVVFIFWGIQFESTVGTSAATVNGEEIPSGLVRQAWQDRQSELQQTLRDELPPELVKSEQAKLVDDFISRELLVQRAHELGYRVSDAELARTLYGIEALQIDGKFSRDRYAALLRQQGRSEAEFESEFRRDLESSQLRNAIAISAFALPSDIKRRVELEGETREMAYAVLPAANFAAQVSVSPADVASYFEKNQREFTTTETAALQYLKLDLASIAAEVEVTEEALRKYYDETASARYGTPERRRASHILIESGTDDAAARQEAEQLAARIKAGEDFAQLAAEHSDDPGSKAAGGDLGWATREAYVPAFADALFGMQAGEVEGPVKTQFGYHLIRLDEIEEAGQRTFEEVRAELEPEYRREQAQNIFYDKSQQLADESFSALTELESVSQKLGLPLQTVESFTRQGGGPFGDDRKVIEAVFSDVVLEQRQNSIPVELGDESVVVLRVVDHKPPQQRPLDAVRDEIEARLRTEAAQKAAADAAQALAQRVNAGESLATAARAVGVEATAPQVITRTGPVTEAAAPLAPELVKAAFRAPRPAGEGKVSAGATTLASGDQAVFVVSSVRSGSLGESPEQAMQMAQAAQSVAMGIAASEFGAYMNDLRRTAKIKRNDRLFAEQ